MPKSNYITHQKKITWRMRQILVNWIFRVCLHWNLLPETLWLTVNIVDRFASKRQVHTKSFQLLGIAAMFIATKFEETCPRSINDLMKITPRNYSKGAIVASEQYILQTLEFRISHYVSPYCWMRAESYDLQTRTLGRFLAEVTLLDGRFVGLKPSLVAEVSVFTATRMLGSSRVSFIPAFSFL